MGCECTISCPLPGNFADGINLFKTPDPVTAVDIAITLAKIILAIPVGIIIAGFCINFAYYFERLLYIDEDEEMAKAEKERRRALGYDE